MTESRKVCTFYIAHYFFGIDVCNIQEVIRYQEMTPVPLADHQIGGLINLRGKIVASIDMNKRLELPPLKENNKPTNIIVYIDSELVSLLVDEIGDVIDIPCDHFETPPENLKGALRSMIKEVCKRDDKLLLILDVEQVIQLK